MISAYFLDFECQEGLEFHTIIRGCPMDFNQFHDDVIKGLKKRRFCAECSKQLNKNKDLKKAGNQLLNWQSE